MINNTWLDSWKAFIGGGEKPGPLSNHELLEDDGVTVKEGLKKAKEYRGLNKSEWEVFFGAYGGGPEIIREGVDIYSNV